MHSFQTKSYMFHYLEVPSGVRIVINTDLSAHDIQTQLWAVYDAFVKLGVSIFNRIIQRQPSYRFASSSHSPCCSCGNATSS